MSLVTWKEEFYPIPASRYMSWESTCQHSLQKWIGLRPENLQKHNVALRPYQLNNPRLPIYLVDDIIVYDCHSMNDIWHDTYLEIGGDSCALCLKSEHVVLEIQDENAEELGLDLEEDFEDFEPMGICDACPIFYLLSVPCDGGVDREYGSPYEDNNKDPLLRLFKEQSPFGIFTETYNPEPMIAVLEDTVKLLQERPKEFFVSIGLKKGFLNQEISPLTFEELQELIRQEDNAFKVDATKLITLQREKAERILEMSQKRLQKEEENLVKYEALDPDVNTFSVKVCKEQIEYYKNRITEVQAKLDRITSTTQGN